MALGRTHRGRVVWVLGCLFLLFLSALFDTPPGFHRLLLVHILHIPRDTPPFSLSCRRRWHVAIQKREILTAMVVNGIQCAIATNMPFVPTLLL